MSVQEDDAKVLEDGFQSVRGAAGEGFSADRMRHGLSVLVSARPVVSFSDSASHVFIPGLPLSGEGTTLDDALDDLVGEIREYAEAWHSRLLNAPNHRDNWGLVMLADLSTDEQLREWLAG